MNPRNEGPAPMPGIRGPKSSGELLQELLRQAQRVVDANRGVSRSTLQEELEALEDTVRMVKTDGLFPIYVPPPTINKKGRP